MDLDPAAEIYCGSDLIWAVLLGSGGWEDLGAWGRRRVNAGGESRGGAQGNSPEKV